MRSAAMDYLDISTNVPSYIPEIDVSDLFAIPLSQLEREVSLSYVPGFFQLGFPIKVHY